MMNNISTHLIFFTEEDKTRGRKTVRKYYTSDAPEGTSEAGKRKGFSTTAMVSNFKFEYYPVDIGSISNCSNIKFIS